MEIKEYNVKRGTIEDFADEYNLIMEVHEREYSDLPRFYARFKKCKIGGNGVLISSFGNGETKEEAIKNYADEISLKVLVFGAYTKERRQIKVWRFI